MNFCRFDPVSGGVTQIGWAAEDVLRHQIANGEPIIIHDGSVQLYGWRINLTTMQPEQIPEELISE